MKGNAMQTVQHAASTETAFSFFVWLTQDSNLRGVRWVRIEDTYQVFAENGYGERDQVAAMFTNDDGERKIRTEPYIWKRFQVAVEVEGWRV